MILKIERNKNVIYNIHSSKFAKDYVLQLAFSEAELWDDDFSFVDVNLDDEFVGDDMLILDDKYHKIESYK